MLAAIDCSPHAVACELSRIAGLLADQSPSWFDWLQFGLTLLSLLATLGVGAAAVFVAAKAHQLSREMRKEAADAKELQERGAFQSKLVPAVQAVATAAVSDPPEPAAQTEAVKAVTLLLADPYAATHPLARRLGMEVKELMDLTEQWGVEQSRISAGIVGGQILVRGAKWVADPDEYAALLESESAADTGQQVGTVVPTPD
ncbi:hypothetical protein ACRAWB_11710 [Leifsonia poae]|uniref:hypothetical protein n=1 Tax=Leifsonia poae TaxID=110933 RepID=UPI003D697195